MMEEKTLKSIEKTIEYLNRKIRKDHGEKSVTALAKYISSYASLLAEIEDREEDEFEPIDDENAYPMATFRPSKRHQQKEEEEDNEQEDSYYAEEDSVQQDAKRKLILRKFDGGKK